MVIEMGGKNNVACIINTLKKVLFNHGYEKEAAKQVFYFPSPGEYISLLELEGFEVEYMAYFKRDTELRDNENGIKDWIKMFGNSFIAEIDENEVNIILEEVQNELKQAIFKNGKWYADYKRLRIVARK